MTAIAAKCPTCNQPLRPGSDGSVRVLACLSCGYVSEVESREVQHKLPGIDPGIQAVLVQEKEEPIMQRVIAALRRAGCHVLCTVHRHTRHTCSACGHNEWHRGGYGADPGVSDLLVRLPGWPIGFAILMETKGTQTPLSDAQKSLQAAGVIVVVRSEADALAALKRADCAMRERSGKDS